MAEGVKEKRPIESTSIKEDSKDNIKRRRRNYDDYDNEVKKADLEKTGIKSEDADSDDDDEESEVDDDKLDMIEIKEDEEEDDLAEIDTFNIVNGSRHRKDELIDYKKTSEELATDNTETSDNASEKVDGEEAVEGGEDEEYDEDEDEDDEDFEVATDTKN